MARSRNLKPGFFANEFLVALGPAHAILFAALWTFADRRGILEDRPGRIKIQVPLVGDLNVDAALNDLQRSPNRFIKRYVGPNGERCIKILNFRKHQNPHVLEKSSNLPDYDPVRCKNRANTIPIGLIPDSLIPDSLIPERDGKTTGAAGAGPLRKSKPKTEPPNREHWQTVFAHVFEWLKKRKQGADPDLTGKDRQLLTRIYDLYGWAATLALWDMWVEDGQIWSKFAHESGHSVGGFYFKKGVMLEDPRWKFKRDGYEKRAAETYVPKADDVPIGDLSGLLKTIGKGGR